MTAIVTAPSSSIVQLPDDVDKRLANLAQKTNHSVQSCVMEALITYIEDREDYLLAEQRLKESEGSGEKTIPFEEIKKSLGFDHE